MSEFELGYVYGEWLEVVHKGRREQLSILVVNEILVERCPDSVYGGTYNHPFHDSRIDLVAAVMNDDIPEKPHGPALGIHLHLDGMDGIRMGDLNIKILSAGALGHLGLVVCDLLQARLHPVGEEKNPLVGEVGDVFE